MGDGRVRYLPEARRELDDALEWYLERSVRAGESFLREVARAIASISTLPAAWQPFEAGTRRFVLRRFPYSIIYRWIERVRS